MTPPYHSGVDEIAGRWIPLGLVYLAGAARQAGLDAEIYDAMAKGHAYPEIEAASACLNGGLRCRQRDHRYHQ